MNIHEIRELATNYSVDELERRARALMKAHADEIVHDPVISESFNSLVKAKMVRSLIDSGMSTNDSIRELGRTMRRAVGRIDRD